MKMKSLLRKLKIYPALLVIGFSTLMSYTYVDSYFEVSKNLDIFTTMFRELNIYYVDDTNPGDLMKKGIDAMLETLDPYTTYIPESEIEDYRFITTGEYGGIGALIRTRDGKVVISEPYEGFPAFKAGLMAGDEIIQIDGKDVAGKNQDDISKLLKGQAGTPVKLVVKRKNTAEPLTKELEREEIKVPNVPYYGMLDETTGYIKLTAFTETASREVKSALVDLRDNQGMKQLVFDLRGNGGGLLRESVNIVNLFVEKGEEVVSTRGKIKEWDKTHKALNNPVDTEMPLVILIDGGSASASEIVSGSIQDLDRGVLIGERSYGKGLVQQTRNLSYNSKLKLTVAKYYIPSGRCIQKIDYSHRNKEGQAERVADSLITEFKTQNGRLVYDGRGIDPDVNVELDPYSEIATALVRKNLIFDYATDFRFANDSIATPKTFRISDDQYNEFVAFLSDKDYDYTTATEDALKELKETAEQEKYFEGAEKLFEDLKARMTPNKGQDLQKFEGEIKEILENELVARYYYQTGRVEASLSKDPYVLKALEVLNNNTMYAGILDGSVTQQENK